MKKSELKNYIRENIISTLSEDTEAEIAKTKELTAAVQDLEAAKKEAGIEEDATPKGEDFFYDYLDIGMSYLEGFGKKHSLDDNQLEKLGKKIVDQLYKGDVGKAYDAIVKRGAMNENEGGDFAELKKHQKMLRDASLFYINKAENLGIENVNSLIQAFNKGVNALETAIFKADYKRTVNEDEEPSDAEIKKNKSLAKAAEELAILTREMKSLAKKYSKAEGQEKENLLKKLKSKTKLKKELDKILDK